MTDHDGTPGRRRHQPIGRAPVLGSAIIHTIAILLALWTSAVNDRVSDFVVFEVELISPPAAELGEFTPPPEDLVIETPFDPAPEPEERTPDPVVEVETPDPEPPPPEPTPPVEATATPDGAPDVVIAPTSQDPDPDVETPGEDLNIRMEGLRRDYPVYYNNINRQMARCFRWRGNENLRARIYFVINSDGSVSDVEILESSGSIAFDIESMGAAECAGRPNRLGPLPEELLYDRLPVQYYFEPRSGRD